MRLTYKEQIKACKKKTFQIDATAMFFFMLIHFHFHKRIHQKSCMLLDI
jgi:hypothetical protein